MTTMPTAGGRLVIITVLVFLGETAPGVTIATRFPGKSTARVERVADEPGVIRLYSASFAATELAVVAAGSGVRKNRPAIDQKTARPLSIVGREAKPLPDVLCQMNLLLHGLDAPQIAQYGADRKMEWSRGESNP